MCYNNPERILERLFNGFNFGPYQRNCNKYMVKFQNVDVCMDQFMKKISFWLKTENFLYNFIAFHIDNTW